MGSARSEVIDWHKLVGQIKAGDQVGMERLYRLFGRGIKYYLWRQLGAQELEDREHDTFLIVVNAIRRGDLREPERLMGFVRTVVRRQVAGCIEAMVHARNKEVNFTKLEHDGSLILDPGKNPEEQATMNENVHIMNRALAALSMRDQDVLKRFYLQEQDKEQICLEMKLTVTQFRLLKNRAKDRFKVAAHGLIFPKVVRTYTWSA